MKIPSLSSIRKAILGALILILLSWHAQQLSNEGKIPLNDFEEYWAACRILLAGGNPYDPSQILELQRNLGSTALKPLMMWNPPWTLPFLLPFCALPFWTGRFLWFLFNLALILLVADWFWIRFGGPSARRWISWLAAIFFIPVGTSLFLGQISALVLAGTAGFLWGVERRRDFWAGSATLAIAIKPHLLYLFWIFLALWIIKEKRGRVLLGALTAVVVFSLIVISINPAIFHNYMAALNSSSGPEVWQTPTWGVALLMLFPDAGEWLRYLPSAAGIIIACALWRSWSHNFNWVFYLPTISLLSVTTSSFSWMFDWVVLLPVVVLLLYWFQASPARLWWLITGLVAVQPLLVISPGITKTNFYTIWMPPALWFLYWAGYRGKIGAIRPE